MWCCPLFPDIVVRIVVYRKSESSILKTDETSSNSMKSERHLPSVLTVPSLSFAEIFHFPLELVTWPHQNQAESEQGINRTALQRETEKLFSCMY